MKKLFLYSVLAWGLALSSCGKDDAEPQNLQEPQADGSVTVSVTLPDDAFGNDSRALPQAYAGHKLRCILIVQENGTVTDRQEKLVDEAQDGSFFFTINPEGEDFKCSFWADYVAEDASATDGKYPDLYYNTESLPAVSYKATGNELFNNDACDAFSLSLLNGATAGTMTRPLAKVSFADERPETVASAGNVSVSNYNVYNGFDIVNGTVSDTPVSISYSGPAADVDNGVWFYNYLFVGNKNSLPGNLTMKVGENTHDVSTENITLTANRKINATLNWERANGIITVDVSFDDPDTPNVGDYYYSDGTWSTSLNAEKTVIGVVFATSETEAAADSPENYDGVTFEDGKIHAWVMGWRDLHPTPRFVNASAEQGASGSTVESIEGVGQGEDDIYGFANCNAWIGNVLTSSKVYVALPNVMDSYAGNYNASVPEGKTSGWYIPAIGQLAALRNAYIAEDSKVKAALQGLVDAGYGSGDANAKVLLVEKNDAGANQYYWSSTAYEGSSSNSVMRMTFVNEDGVAVTNQNGGSSGSPCRPILTF